ncbi:hypothetical protein [Granulicella sibirica]|uniref:Putative cell-wall-anchored protein SasA (LPXTG motif) n=1 Tax=Granulicella sibirica TaxID=2479048 RepID=A0A4Q0SWN4_9BACT|nr:hypothetical protein [Granulicella sibirica]RXH54822.1 putative cell-wall-anchored protein SasA (LPXTG motif) [Granulicella sibirica]
MSISAVSSSDLSALLDDLYTSSSTTTTSKTSTSNGTDSFSSTLSELESAISSGNLTSAKEYLSEVEKASPRSTNGTDPIGTFLTSVENALSSGDISSAQKALTTLQSAPGPGSSAQSSGSDFDTELSSLESAIQSGDLTSAAKYLSALEADSPSHSATSAASTSSSATTASSASGNSASDPIGTFLKSVEAAVANGSLSAAVSALNIFQSQAVPSSVTSSSISVVA